jgi:hypothetical protein
VTSAWLPLAFPHARPVALLAASQDQTSNGVCIIRSAFESIPKVNRAWLCLIGSLDVLTREAARVQAALF